MSNIPIFSCSATDNVLPEPAYFAVRLPPKVDPRLFGAEFIALSIRAAVYLQYIRMICNSRKARVVKELRGVLEKTGIEHFGERIARVDCRFRRQVERVDAAAAARTKQHQENCYRVIDARHLAENVLVVSTRLRSKS